VLRCLQKEPAARFQTAAEVKNTLTQLINHLAQEETVVIPAPPASESTIIFRKPLNAAHEQPRQQPAATSPDEVELPRGGGASGWIIAILFVVLAAAVTYGAFWIYGTKKTPPPPTPKVMVPDLIGLDEANAKSVLAARHLIAQRGEDKPSATYEKGKVCEQSPAKDTEIDPNTPVFYYLSGGSVTFQMPDVSLMSISVAKSNIRGAADDTDPKKPLLDFVQTKEASDTVPKGFVIRTDPAAGAQVKRVEHTKITLVISTGMTEVIFEEYHPGKAVNLNPDDTTVYIKIEMENPVGSEPQTLVADTFNTGDDIPVQRFQRKATDTAIVRMYAARDENGELEKLDEQTFAPKPTPPR
jgi:serine/threonine-protein kinase